MALKTILNKQTDFTGEFPVEYAKSGLWRFNDVSVDENGYLADSSGLDRKIELVNYLGTTASLQSGQKGRQIRININNPATEKTYLKVANDGTFFSEMGERILVGGWMIPTTYSVGNTYCPILNTRYGPGQPIFYLSLFAGRPRIMLYNASGSLILDQTTTPPFSLINGGVYFICMVIEPNNKNAWIVLGDRTNEISWVSPTYSFTGSLNPSCTADIIMGMHADAYWYAGRFDDWFFDMDSSLTTDELIDYFNGSLLTNGGDMGGAVDALTVPGVVSLRETEGVYPTEGTLYTAPATCNLSGTGRVSVTSEYISGVTAVGPIETSTSDDLVHWSDWAAIALDGKLVSPNKAYIRFRVTLTTADTSKTPRIIDIRLYDIPK